MYTNWEAIVLTKNIDTPIGPSSENTPVAGNMIIPSVHGPTHVRVKEEQLRRQVGRCSEGNGKTDRSEEIFN